MSSYINSQLTSFVFENANLQVVTRQHMDKVENELKFQNSGLVSDSTALSIGERLGAHAIIFGSLRELDNKYTLEVKMLNVKTGSYSLFKKYQIKRSAMTEQLLHHAATIYKASLGLLFEGNKNSISGMALCTGISFDYNITRNLSFGARALISYDTFMKEKEIYAVEPLGFMRWYVAPIFGEPSGGVFAEAQGGAEFIIIDSNIKNTMSAGLSLGVRIPFGSFYVEPYMRGGYPYMFGAGIGAGCRF